MNKPSNKRLVWFAVIVFIIAGAGIGYAAVPQSTVQTTAGGITTYVGHYGNFTEAVESTEYFLDSVNKTDIFAYPQQDYSYTIFTDGTNYYAKNGTTGTIDYSGAVAHTVINNALNGLSAGRTWKEKIVVTGNITLSGKIAVPSFTILDLKTVQLTLENNVDNNMLTNLDLIGGNTEIEILGGYFDGNGDNQAAGCGIYFANVTNFIIDGSTFYDCNRQGLEVSWSSNGLIQNCNATLNGDDGFSVTDGDVASISRNIAFKNCYSWDHNTLRSGVTYGSGFEVDDGPQYISFDTCYAWSTTKNVTSVFHQKVGFTVHTHVGEITPKYISFRNCYSTDHTTYGFQVIEESQYVTVADSYAFNNTSGGIYFADSSDFGEITGNTALYNFHGVFLSGSKSIAITGNTCNNNTQSGIYLTSSTDNAINGNTCGNNTRHGIYLTSNSHQNTVSGNACSDNIWDGVHLAVSSNNTITGNTLTGNDKGELNAFSGITLSTQANDNLITGNICNDNNRYGIVVDNANCYRNWIKNNQLRGNGNKPFLDSGTDTKLESLTLSFVEGTTFLSTAPFGFEIDVNTEYATVLAALPAEVQYVSRWKIYATSVVTETHNMTLQVLGYAGADNQPYSTETISLATLNSTSFNFVANDVIYWTVTLSDDTDFDDMFGNDQLMIQVLHEAASGGACQTDAIFTCIIIEYV